MLKILYDDLLRYEIEASINELVFDSIKEMVKRRGVILLPKYPEDLRFEVVEGLSRYENKNRVVYMVAGGPATGKSSILARLERDFEKEGVSASDFCRISPDRYKPLLGMGTDLSLGEDKRFHGPLTNEESRIIAEGIRERVLEMARFNLAPNVIMEHLVPYEHRIEFATFRDSHFRLFVTFSDPVDAVDGSYNRYHDTGRHVPKEAVIQGQKSVTLYLPKVLKKYQGTQKNIRISLFDTTHQVTNNVFDQSISTVGTEIAIINPSLLIVKLLDPMKFLEFIKRGYLDPKAEKPEDIYSEPAQVSMDNLAEQLLKGYGNGIIQFYHTSSSTVSTRLQAKVFAEYNGKTHVLTIINPNLFEEFTPDAKRKELFEVIERCVNSIQAEIAYRR